MRRTNARTRRTGREHGFYAYHGARGHIKLGPIVRGGPLSVSMLPDDRRRIAFSYHCHVQPGDLVPSTNDVLSAIRDNEPLFFIGTPDGWIREFRPRQGTAAYIDVLQRGLMDYEVETKASARVRFTRSSAAGLYVGRKFYRVLDARGPRKLPRVRRREALRVPW